jgi:hypothetical protein
MTGGHKPSNRSVRGAFSLCWIVAAVITAASIQDLSVPTARRCEPGHIGRGTGRVPCRSCGTGRPPTTPTRDQRRPHRDGMQRSVVLRRLGSMARTRAAVARTRAAVARTRAAVARTRAAVARTRAAVARTRAAVARTRAVMVMLLAAALVVIAGCTSGHQGRAALPAKTSSASSTPMPSRTSSGTSGPRTTTASVTAVRTSPAVPHLLAELRSVPFRSPLPSHLRVRGVGTWTYIDAGHVGTGYVGSAQVLIRSSIKGETVTAIYDVFTAASQARARFNVAESNFTQLGRLLHHSIRLLRLSPAVGAFCGPQAAPGNTTTCWFDSTVVNGIVTTTAPPEASGDGPAVLQAMLSHLLALAG